MTAKYKVGDTVIYADRYGRNQVHRMTILKVGRKYFYVDTYKTRRFSVEDGVHRDDYGSVRAYTPEEWAHEEALKSANAELRGWGVRLDRCFQDGQVLAIRDALKPILGTS